jgi:HSP20 family protein
MNSLSKIENRSPGEVSTTPRPTYVIPPADILETPEGYMLEVEMPGVTKEGLEIVVENGELAIVGHYTAPEVKGREIFRETRRADYRRVFELDPSIDLEKIGANIDQGVLKLRLPKTESVKPRKIEVS